MQLHVGDVIKDWHPATFRVEWVTEDGEFVGLSDCSAGVMLSDWYNVKALFDIGYRLHLGSCLLEDTT